MKKIYNGVKYSEGDKVIIKHTGEIGYVSMYDEDDDTVLIDFIDVVNSEWICILDIELWVVWRRNKTLEELLGDV